MCPAAMREEVCEVGRWVPGQRVLLPGAPEWGVGQVQSAIGDRVTVTFEHAGKRVVDTALVPLAELEDDGGDAPRI